MARSVNEINIIVLPSKISGSRLDSNTFFSLQLHKIHSCSNAIRSFDFVDGIYFTGIEENSLRKGCFAWINMRRNADVSYFWVISSKGKPQLGERMPGYKLFQCRMDMKHAKLKFNSTSRFILIINYNLPIFLYSIFEYLRSISSF